MIIQSLKNLIFSFIRLWFGCFSTDCTSTLPAGPVLVIAPHPDDETIGCGAAIARFCEEKRSMHVLIVTDGRSSAKSAIITPDELAALRRQEALNAAEKLGLTEKNVFFLDHPNGETEALGEAIYNDIAVHVATLAPSVIFAPHPLDEHREHRAVSAVVGRLQDEKKISGIVLHYPVWYQIYAWPYGILRCLFSPASYSRCRRLHTKGFLGRKAEAMKEYRSQFENLTGEEGWGFFPKLVFDRFCAPEIFFERKKR